MRVIVDCKLAQPRLKSMKGWRDEIGASRSQYPRRDSEEDIWEDCENIRGLFNTVFCPFSLGTGCRFVPNMLSSSRWLAVPTTVTDRITRPA